MAISDGHEWGQWRYNKASLTLDYVDYEPGKQGEIAYQVDFERCGTADDILDWILQLSAKNWIRAEDIGDLVQAFRELAGGGLQGKIIGGGSGGKSFDWVSHLTSN